MRKIVEETASFISCLPLFIYLFVSYFLNKKIISVVVYLINIT